MRNPIVRGASYGLVVLYLSGAFVGGLDWVSYIMQGGAGRLVLLMLCFAAAALGAIIAGALEEMKN